MRFESRWISTGQFSFRKEPIDESEFSKLWRMGRMSEGYFAIRGKSLPATTDNEARGLGNSIGFSYVACLGRMIAIAV